MDDSTKPKVADIQVTGKALHINRNATQAEWYEDGKQYTKTVNWTDIGNLTVGAQTITPNQMKSIMTALFEKIQSIV
jgi:hypothetical protein